MGTEQLGNYGIFEHRPTVPNVFSRYIIYWIADNHISTQATFVMLLIKAQLHC
jgi:hypothetical protein